LKDWKEIEQTKSWYLNWLDKEKSCICSLFTGYRIFTHKYTYSWSRILRGKLRKGPRENLVRDKISVALAFLFFSSPSFPPEARWLHTKQKLVSCKQNLTETDPCIYKPYWSSTSTHTDLFALIFFSHYVSNIYIYVRTLFPRQPMMPQPTQETLGCCMYGRRSFLTQTVIKIPTICLLVIQSKQCGKLLLLLSREAMLWFFKGCTL